ncbi:branched-chain amino acid ABC transporter permease [Jannaschia pagri]|uniref:Branched-chain amino acid ABC transporter permease n=1 Tax=Jannaschia pagri TaxID=2829797 RepID=A0ABQ4NI67_9RHOB|nr:MULTISPECIES: urea ABC transporter permease subunit UrtB [unclassified Jannaschia]GIT90009.1 branched-chain amino acid ABC transporter permease [Jannaschia sp. AI_61]GIT93885.1 branched-chain amino acid ABC transporter permease [Jannaschia sp. AI_62]
MRLILALVLMLTGLPAMAQNGPVQTLLQTYADDIAKPSRRTIQPVLDDLAASGLPAMPSFLEAWADKGIVQRDEDGLFFYGTREGDIYVLRSVEDGSDAGEVGRREASELKPNAGVRRLIGTALVQFQLNDPDPARRRAALESLSRSPSADLLEPLRASIEGEEDPALRARKVALDRLITVRFGTDLDTRLAAIDWMSDQVSLEARAALNGLLTTDRIVGAPDADANVARVLTVGDDITEADALALLADEDILPPEVTRADRDAALIAALDNGEVAGTPVHTLNTEAARWTAYEELAAAGQVPARPPEDAVATLLAENPISEVYDEPDPTITAAAEAALAEVTSRVARAQAADLGLDALSLASIYFLAAIGLAITFGVMGVINMAHGEFIMLGAYTGYVVQQVVPDYTVSLIIALPLAFVVAAAAGVALERLVIRHLAHRPLETLLATFGISVAVQQIVKNVFGTQAVPLTSPDWLAGAWVVNDVIGISYIRIGIFVLALIFLGVLVYILRRTRLGLEVRAVTQNPGMAASLGIDPDRVGMATFALGSGIAGVAGVAIGLFAQVTSEMGAGYIVQSFMTVVVGGVGSVFGTLAGAGLIGGLQKGIEWLNPSNTLAAQTYMILFIILFIQVRPRGIVAQKGRHAQ